MSTSAKSEKDRVVIFDTTLRDGEQCPGATMTHEEKIEVAELLDTMGVDIIEAGFPIASEGDFAAVHEIAKRAKNAPTVPTTMGREKKANPFLRADDPKLQAFVGCPGDVIATFAEVRERKNTF